MVSDFLRYTVGAMLFLAMVSILIIAPLMLISLNRTTYTAWVNAHSEFTPNTVEHVIDDVLSALEGGELSNIVFSDAEKSHIYDVAQVFAYARIVVVTSVVLLFFFALFVIWYKQDAALFFLSLSAAGAFVTIASAMLVVAVAGNFEWVFEWMHQILFPQGNWQFPPEAVLVRIFPSHIFEQLAYQIGSTIAATSILVATSMYYMLRRIQH